MQNNVTVPVFVKATIKNTYFHIDIIMQTNQTKAGFIGGVSASIDVESGSFADTIKKLREEFVTVSFSFQK